MAKTGKRKKKVETVFLVCEETGDYNYTLRRKSGGEKLKLSKFCPRLRKHTMQLRRRSNFFCGRILRAVELLAPIVRRVVDPRLVGFNPRG